MKESTGYKKKKKRSAFDDIPGRNVEEKKKVFCGCLRIRQSIKLNLQRFIPPHKIQSIIYFSNALTIATVLLSYNKLTLINTMYN